MSHYERYAAYRDSGVEWIGEIPEHWEVKRLKYIATCNDESLNENSDPQYEIKYIDISSVNLSQGITHKEILPFEKAPSRARRIVRHGDTIVSTVRTYLKAIAPIIEPDENLIVSTGFAVIRSMKFYSYRFLGYFLQTEGFVGQVVANSVGVSYPAINANELLQFSVIVPPLEEQQAIASFLDRKTAEIDELITKKEELLKKLDEKRTALITRAVTKGIDPSVPMKESGVEWLGEVPEHWEVTRIKFIFPRLYSGVSVNSDTFPSEQDSIGVLKTSCVYGNRFSPEENKKVIDEETEKVACPVTKDSVIISRMNTPDLVGSCGYVEFDYPNLFLPDRLWIARFENHKKMVGKFVWYLISSDTIVKLTGILATGTSGSMKNLSQDSFLNIATAVPPIEEQHTITLFLDQTTATIDRQKTQVTEAIERLKEYRSALITDAVTGKMDVHSIGKKESLST